MTAMNHRKISSGNQRIKQMKTVLTEPGGDGRVVRWCWVSVLLIWIIEGQEPTALSVGAGGGVWTFFSHLSFLSSSSLSLEDGPI